MLRHARDAQQALDLRRAGCDRELLPRSRARSCAEKMIAQPGRVDELQVVEVEHELAAPRRARGPPARARTSASWRGRVRPSRRSTTRSCSLRASTRRCSLSAHTGIVPHVFLSAIAHPGSIALPARCRRPRHRGTRRDAAALSGRAARSCSALRRQRRDEPQQRRTWHGDERGRDQARRCAEQLGRHEQQRAAHRQREEHQTRRSRGGWRETRRGACRRCETARDGMRPARSCTARRTPSTATSRNRRRARTGRRRRSRLLNGTISRNANSTCTPVTTTRSSPVISSRLRSRRCSGVSGCVRRRCLPDRCRRSQRLRRPLALGSRRWIGLRACSASARCEFP